MVTNFKRQVTHSGYKNPRKLKKYHHRVVKKITVKDFIPIRKEAVGLKSLYYLYADQNYLVVATGSNALPLMGGGVSALILLMYTFGDIKWDFIETFVFVLSTFALLFFIVYFFTMPSKENILNRIDGLITFTGVFWQKNITLKFEDVEFAASTGGEDGTGAFNLEVIPPNKWQTFAVYGLCNANCYKDISAITWYMDKNRPLPPGTAFDPYRQQDFERRKAEGFPKPLYPSNVPTPEATKEQQKERFKIGGW